MLFVAAIFVAALIPLAFAALELAARWWITRSKQYFVRTPFERVHMTLDRTALPSLPAEAWFEVNADGERGDPVPSDRRDLYRVLVAGGSAAECSLLDQQTAWPARLQELLSDQTSLQAIDAQHVHVGNIGRSLTPCEAVCSMLERTLPRYDKLDLLILMVGASDVLDWLEHGTPSEIPQKRFTADQIFAEHPEHRYGWTPSRLALRQIAARIYRRYTGKVYRRANAGRRLIEFRKRRQQAKVLVKAVPDPKPMLDNFEKHFRRLVELGRKKGARVVLVRQPWLDRELTPAEERLMWNFCATPLSYDRVATTYYAHEAVRPLLRAADRRAAGVAAELGIQDVDLSAAVAPTLDNFYDYHHFTVRGAALVAEAVASAITGEAAAVPQQEQPAIAGSSVRRRSVAATAAAS